MPFTNICTNYDSVNKYFWFEFQHLKDNFKGMFTSKKQHEKFALIFYYDKLAQCKFQLVLNNIQKGLKMSL